MLKDVFSDLFERDLNKLKDEISAYNPESRLWIVKNEIKNSAGNLCYHITGGLLFFVGNVLGKTGFIRDRDAEFTEKDIPKRDLLIRIDDTKKVVLKTFESLDDSALKSKYPYDLLKKEATTDYFLVHLFGHLNYHLGQINYHRRLLE